MGGRAIPSEPFVFVSYAHEDLALIRGDLDRLARQRTPIWYDADLTPGQPWAAQLADTIDAAALLLIFLTPRSVRSRHCLDEVHFALQRDKRILTVYVEDVSLPPELELGLGRHQGIRRFAMSSSDYLDRLPMIVDTLVERAAQAPSRRASDREPQDQDEITAALGVDDLRRLADARLELPCPLHLAEAHAFLDAALQRAPDDARVHACLAQTLCAYRYPFLFSWNPRATRSLLFLWSGYDQQRTPASARAHAMRALELDADCAPAHVAMATILLGENNREDAAPHIEAARTAAPVDPSAAVVAVVALARSGDADSATALMDGTIAQHPGSALLHFHAARLQDRLGRKEASAQHTQRALELAPAWSGALLLQAEMVAKNGDPVDACRWLHRAIDSEPPHFANQTSLVALLTLLDAPRLARLHLQRIDARSAPAGMIDALELNMLAAEDRLEEVVERSERWLEQEPLAPIPLLFAAHGHLMRGNTGAAISHLEDHLRPHRDADGSLPIEVTNALAAILYRVACTWSEPGSEQDEEQQREQQRELQKVMIGLDRMEAAGNVTPELFYGRACITALLGDHETAVAELARALGRGHLRLWEIRQFVGYQELRATPAYQKLMAELRTRRAEELAAIEALEP